MQAGGVTGYRFYLPVAEAERDAWLLCMERAIAQQGYGPEFSAYLLDQLGFPAQRIFEVCRGVV